VIRAIIFDCDGVLVDSEVIAQEVEMSMLGEIGLHYNRREFNVRFMGTSEAAFWESLEADGLARLGRSITAELRAPLNARIRVAFRERLAAVPGAREAVSSVRQLKAVASSSSSRALRVKLKRVGLWDQFAPHVYSADHVTHAKPAPDLFLYSAAMLNVPVDECLVIEDSMNGVRAALAAGMRAWGFLGGSHHDEDSGARLIDAGAERIVDDWPAAALLFQELDTVSR
jgi:HAD superfamily hydrolase (TIGR01509 family)